MFHKKPVINEDLVQSYCQEFSKFIEEETNECVLFSAFTRITILRIQLDAADNLFTNLRDKKKLRENCEVKKLIMLQFEDILASCRKYTAEERASIDACMKAILPQPKVDAWTLFWKAIMDAFDRAAGKK